MEKRRGIRRTVSQDEPLAHARLRTGGRLRILEASSWGALAQTADRLLPGRQLDVHIVSADGRALVRCRVSRAFVVKVEADAMHYHVALSFDRAIDVRLDGYALPSPVLVGEAGRGIPYPERTVCRDIEFSEPLAFEENGALPTLAPPLV